MLRLFLALATQWRVTALPDGAAIRLLRTGLDYSALVPVQRHLGLRPDARAFDWLQQMEQAALDEWAAAPSSI